MSLTDKKIISTDLILSTSAVLNCFLVRHHSLYLPQFITFQPTVPVAAFPHLWSFSSGALAVGRPKRRIAIRLVFLGAP